MMGHTFLVELYIKLEHMITIKHDIVHFIFKQIQPSQKVKYLVVRNQGQRFPMSTTVIPEKLLQTWQHQLPASLVPSLQLIISSVLNFQLECGKISEFPAEKCGKTLEVKRDQAKRDQKKGPGQKGPAKRDQDPKGTMTKRDHSQKGPWPKMY